MDPLNYLLVHLLRTSNQLLDASNLIVTETH